MRSLPSIVHLETSHISTDDHFAALQIDLCVRGWIEGLGRNRRLHHSHQFLNYVLSFLAESPHFPQKNGTYYTYSRLKKQGGTEISNWDNATKQTNKG